MAIDLFNTAAVTNVLPVDGIADYHGKVLKPQEADMYLDKLLKTVAWKNDKAIIFGKHFITDRMVAWYGDTEFLYTYSKTTKQALVWTEELAELKNLVEKLSGARYNSCLLNLYHHGAEGLGWHSDDEKTLGHHAAIASLSLGAERKFVFKHKQTKQNVPIMLEHGSLLVMRGATQTNWLHSLPKTTKVTRPRINLTFRTIVI